MNWNRTGAMRDHDISFRVCWSIGIGDLRCSDKFYIAYILTIVFLRFAMFTLRPTPSACDSTSLPSYFVFLRCVRFVTFWSPGRHSRYKFITLHTFSLFSLRVPRTWTHRDHFAFPLSCDTFAVAIRAYISLRLIHSRHFIIHLI